MENTILVILIILLIFVGFMIFKNTAQPNAKSKALKKGEIEQQYIDDLKAILAKCDTKEERTAQKKVFMQKVNSELSRNVFFDEGEAKKFLQKLAVV